MVVVPYRTVPSNRTMENILDMTEEELEAELLRQLEEMPSSDEEPDEQQQQIDTLAVSRGKLLSAPDENTPPQPAVSSWELLMSSVDANSSILKTFEENIGEIMKLTAQEDAKPHPHPGSPTSSPGAGTDAPPAHEAAPSTPGAGTDRDATEGPSSLPATFLTAAPVSPVKEARDQPEHGEGTAGGPSPDPPSPEPPATSSPRPPVPRDMSPNQLKTTVDQILDPGDVNSLAKEMFEGLSPEDQQYLEEQRAYDKDTLDRIAQRDEEWKRREEDQAKVQGELEEATRRRDKEIEQESELHLANVQLEIDSKAKQREERERERQIMRESEEKAMKELQEKLEEDARRHEEMLLEEARQEELERERRLAVLKQLWAKEEKAAVTVQSRLRAFLAKRRFAILARRSRAATKIQALARRRKATKCVQTVRSAKHNAKMTVSAVTLQCFVRVCQAKRERTRRRHARAASTIQCLARRRQACRRAHARRRANAERKLSRLRIQAFGRLVLAKNACRRRRDRKALAARRDRSAVTIQSFARGLFARRKCSELKLELSKKRKERASVHVQRLARGHIARKRALRRREERKRAESVKGSVLAGLGISEGGAEDDGPPSAYARVSIFKLSFAVPATAEKVQPGFNGEPGEPKRRPGSSPAGAVGQGTGESSIQEEGPGGGAWPPAPAALHGTDEAGESRSARATTELEATAKEEAASYMSSVFSFEAPTITSVIPQGSAEPVSECAAILIAKQEEVEQIRKEILTAATEMRALKEGQNDPNCTPEEKSSIRKKLGVALKNLKSMKTLYEMQLQEVDEEKEKLQVQESCGHYKMSLDNRNILPLDELLRKYPNLRSLNLSQNKLTDVRGFVDQGSKQQLILESLDLADNEVTDLAPLRACSAYLQCLHLDGNGIESLRSMFCTEPGSVTTYPRLRVLTACNNGLHEIDVLLNNASSVKRVEHLKFYRNQLTHIPEGAFDSLEFLRSIDLGRNMLRHVPDEAFAQNKLLQSLVLYENDIADMPKNLNNALLKDVWLNGNALTDINNGSSAWTPSLEKLYLHDNKIKSLSRFTGAPFLKTVDLSFNSIETFEEIEKFAAQCPLVEVARFNDNPLSEDADEGHYRTTIISMFPKLVELDGNLVTGEERAQANMLVSLGNSQTVFKWLEMDQKLNGTKLVGGLQTPIRGDNGVDWSMVSNIKSHEMKQVSHRDKRWAWQAFHNIVLRQRSEVLCLIRRHSQERDNHAQKYESAPFGEPTEMALAFKHDTEMRSMAKHHLTAHELFRWDTSTAARGRISFVKNESFEFTDDDCFERPNAVGEKGKAGRPMTASTKAAVQVQALYRGYAARKATPSRAPVPPPSVVPVGEPAKTEMPVAMDDLDDGMDEFEEIDVDEFLNLDMDIDVDEFDHMERLTNNEAWGSAVSDEDTAGAPSASFNGTVRTGGFGAHQSVPEEEPGMSRVSHSSHNDRLADDASRRVQDYAQAIPFDTMEVPSSATSSMRGSPHPPRSADELRGSADRIPQMKLPSSPSGSSVYSVQSQPMSSRETMLQKEVEKVANEWGFSDHQVAQAMLMRKNRFNKAKKSRNREKRLQDPDYKYKMLMRKVKANRGGGGLEGGSVSSERKRPGSHRRNGSHSASRPHRIVSQVGKDRANMRRKRRNRPGWTKPTRAPGDSGGGARPRKKTEKNMGAQMKLNNWTVGNEATFENVDDGQKENQGGRRKRAQGQGSGGMFPPLM